MQHLDSDRRTRHLHQAQYALLHTCTTRCGEDDIRAFRANCGLYSIDECLTDRHAHGTTHERKILHADDNGLSVNLATRGFHGVLFTRGKARRLDPVDIFFGVSELQRIFADDGRFENVVVFVVE